MGREATVGGTRLCRHAHESEDLPSTFARDAHPESAREGNGLKSRPNCNKNAGFPAQAGEYFMNNWTLGFAALAVACAQNPVDTFDTFETFEIESSPPPISITADTLAPATTGSVRVNGVAPGGLVGLLASRQLGNGPCLSGGTCLGIDGAIIRLGYVIADSQGTAWFDVALPPFLDPDVDVHFQAVELSAATFLASLTYTADISDPVSIMGDWTDNWGGTHEIDGERWMQSGFGAASSFWFTQYDNDAGGQDAGWAVAHNDPANPWSADLWSRFHWVTVNGQLWYCQSEYAAATEMDALLSIPPDASNPATGGCSGFSWSTLNPAP